MIGQLQGVLSEKNPPFLLLDVAGVGYELEAPMSTFYQLPEIGVPVKLITHLVVREDAHILYGFYSKQERTLFRQLIRVSSIGPRSAISILSALDYAQFLHAIACKDLSALTRVPGIGKKTAERLLLEMQDKLRKEITAWEAGNTNPGQRHTTAQHHKNHPLEEATQALLALGYKSHEAEQALRGLEDHCKQSASVQELIRLALQNMH